MTPAELATDPLLQPLGYGLTAVQHRERYGYDLSWVQLRGAVLHCASCGDRVRLQADYGVALKGAVCGAFIENHAGCVRIAAKPRRA